MMIRVLVCIGVLILLTASLQAQTSPKQELYFLSAGISTVPAKLYHLPNNSTTAELIREVAPTVETVLADYDLRKLVVVSPAITPHVFSVVEMSSPAAQHSASIDYDPSQMLPSGIYLLALPDGHLRVGMPLGQLWKPDHPQPARDLSAIRLDSPNATVETLPFSALSHVRVSGYVGGGQALSSQQVPEVRGDPLHIVISDPAGHTTTIPRPPYIKVNPDPFAPGYRLFAVNDSIDALLPVVFAPSDVIDVFDKAAGTWHRVALPFTVTRARAFGSWVTAISAEPRGGKSWIPPHSINTADLRALRSSPGKAKRMATELSRFRDTRTTVDDLFDNSTDFYPGDLIVFNGHASRIFTIHTGEGDSEVVLCTNSAVYYRVNDGLYRADLVSGSLTAGTKIAEGPEIVQAHWAFLGPPLGIGSAAPQSSQSTAPSEILGTLLSRMEDPSWEARSRALYEMITLGLGDAPGSRTRLFKQAILRLRTVAPDKRDQLMDSIGRLVERENLIASSTRFSEEYSTYYGDAIATLAAAVDVFPDPRLLDPVIGALHTGNMAMNAAVRFGDVAVPRLTSLTGSHDPRRRECALLVLQRMLQPEVLHTLTAPTAFRAQAKNLFLEKLADENAGVRQAAVTGLGVIGDRSVIPQLQAIAINDPACLKGQKADDGSGDLCPVRQSARRVLASLLP